MMLAGVRVPIGFGLVLVKGWVFFFKLFLLLLFCFERGREHVGFQSISLLFFCL